MADEIVAEKIGTDTKGSGDEVTDKVQPEDGKVGWVYVLYNPSMPSLVKIGYSTRDPKLRANELSKHAGVPTKFILVYKEKFDDCKKAEEIIHQKLVERGLRVSENREFFRMTVEEAVRVLVGEKGRGSSIRDMGDTMSHYNFNWKPNSTQKITR
ncbi:GIY-YIG nuclease family protein [Ornithinibacillus halotolerans]|uniref:Bacteriophage T5 Orf172 DNA-binding domain-containing protein n=1 Tax=Ornithinibacillus halotolerans TaxID=1274357 RepID=A0A916RSE4_9BACI|nr:GIY-YIG nuclease family protein [Ornithinibacillus halotolerans]GGA65207.1 hypothetical protein GCM10008025_06330 [Ornithinibacillus halotolerans]